MKKWILFIVFLTLFYGLYAGVKLWPQNLLKEYVVVWKNDALLNEMIDVLDKTSFKYIELILGDSSARVKTPIGTQSLPISADDNLLKLYELLEKSDIYGLIAYKNGRWLIQGLQQTIELEPNDSYQYRWIENIRYLYRDEIKVETTCSKQDFLSKPFGKCSEHLVGNWNVLNEWKTVESTDG